jgi:peptidoglycan/xylan/chitin deacetylase (PgdA/CDA1 family)
VAYWSGWGLDWEETPSERIVAEVGGSLQPGSIVLLHDTAQYGHRTTASATARAVDPIVELGRSRGLIWRTLAEATSGR